MSQFTVTPIRLCPAVSRMVEPVDPPSGVKMTCDGLSVSPDGSIWTAPPSTENPFAAVTTVTIRSWAMARERASFSALVSAATVASVVQPMLCQGCLTRTSPATAAMMTITTIISIRVKPAECGPGRTLPQVAHDESSWQDTHLEVVGHTLFD